VKQVGCDLGVRYVLEGSVRRAGNRVRIASQLIDASTGAHLWADRFDEALERIFDLQDQVTASVVGQLVPKLEQAEIERAKRKPTSSLDAYQCYLRGMASHYQFTEAGTKEALSFFYKAIDLDPDFASAHGWAAVCYTSRMQSNWMDDPSREVEEGLRLARRAVALGRDDALALACGGFTLAYLGGELETGAAFIDRALKLNPNWAPAWHASGWVRVYLGEHDLAAEHLAQSMRLSPFDPQMFQLATATALAHFFAGRHDDAVSWSGKALMEQPNFAPALRIFAVNSAMAGREKDAERAVSHLRRLYPTHRISVLKTQMPLRRPEDLAKWVEGLRKIGLPE
jgi:adenylate cyclase